MRDFCYKLLQNICCFLRGQQIAQQNVAKKITSRKPLTVFLPFYYEPLTVFLPFYYEPVDRAFTINTLTDR